MASRAPIQLRNPPTRRAWIRRTAALWLCVLFAAGASAQSKPTEYDVKAAYLLNFGKFMRSSGPQPQHNTFDICILGRDPIGQAIDSITANENIENHPVRVLRMADAHEARKCNIAFISPYEGDAIRADLATLAGAPTLTVSDAPDFLNRGGMIQFLIQQDHVRFAVNLNAVDRSHLVLSSELLRVAAAVQGKPTGVPR